jgi:hypothetical protein
MGGTILNRLPSTPQHDPHPERPLREQRASKDAPEGAHGHACVCWNRPSTPLWVTQDEVGGSWAACSRLEIQLWKGVDGHYDGAIRQQTISSVKPNFILYSFLPSAAQTRGMPDVETRMEQRGQSRQVYRR